TASSTFFRFSALSSRIGTPVAFASIITCSAFRNVRPPRMIRAYFVRSSSCFSYSMGDSRVESAIRERAAERGPGILRTRQSGGHRSVREEFSPGCRHLPYPNPQCVTKPPVSLPETRGNSTSRVRHPVMGTTAIVLLSLGGVALLLIFWLIGSYNGLVV